MCVTLPRLCAKADALSSNEYCNSEIIPGLVRPGLAGTKLDRAELRLIDAAETVLATGDIRPTKDIIDAQVADDVRHDLAETQGHDGQVVTAQAQRRGTQ